MLEGQPPLSIRSSGLVLGAILSVQIGSGLAAHLFATVGPAGATFMRIVFATPILLLMWRPTLKGHSRTEFLLAAAFGLTIAAMNLAFYASLNRIPLGVAVTLEFVGPLGLGVAGSRRALDLLWVVLAAGGVVLLAPWGGLALDPTGVVLALLSGGCWALYIILSARVGRAFPGGRGLAIAMIFSAIAVAPIGVLNTGSRFLQPGILAAGLAVAILSSIIPYSLELEALRIIPTRVFGVLMSTEPAVAALVGFLLIGQTLRPRALVAIVLVMAAAVGASQDGANPAVD